MLTLLTLVWLGPTGPVSYYAVVFSLMSIPAALLARSVFALRGSLSLVMLTAAMVSLGIVSPIVDPLPLQGRLLVIAQCVAVAGALIVDLRRGALLQAVPWSPVTTRRVAIAAIVLLTLAVLATVVGYIGPARVLRNIVLGAGGLALLVVVATHLLYGLVAALSETRIARRLRIVSRDPASVRRAALIALRVVGWIAWVVGMLIMVGRLDWTVQLVENVVDTKFKIGAATVSTAAIFAGLAVVAGTYVLVKVLRLLLDIELLPRLTLDHGVSFAVSAVIRYGLITAGVRARDGGDGDRSHEGDAARGRDRRRRRPRTAGRRQQLRLRIDSARRAADQRRRRGASRRLEWCRAVDRRTCVDDPHVGRGGSDRPQRRSHFQGGHELDVEAIAREGSRSMSALRAKPMPESVVRLLETAATEVEGISAKPSPRARLSKLGADRTYRLYAWIDDVDRSGEVQSALRMSIAKKFSEARIEIK